jgi:hypothetical protein
MIKINSPFDIIGTQHTALNTSCQHSDINCCTRCSTIINHLVMLRISHGQITDGLDRLRDRKNKKEELLRIRSSIQRANTAIEILLHSEDQK